MYSTHEYPAPGQLWLSPRSYVGVPTFAHPQLSIIILDFSHTEVNELSAWDDRLRAHRLISTYL